MDLGVGLPMEFDWGLDIWSWTTTGLYFSPRSIVPMFTSLNNNIRYMQIIHNLNLPNSSWRSKRWRENTSTFKYLEGTTSSLVIFSMAYLLIIYFSFLYGLSLLSVLTFTRLAVVAMTSPSSEIIGRGFTSSAVILMLTKALVESSKLNAETFIGPTKR